jgi:acyl-CoA synthetase (AMP-forming)/AMP-acid ligase II
VCLPPGEVGEFVVRGPVVTREYFHRPEATKLAKMRDPKTGDILHRMGDVGYLDEQGRLWFCGRKSHRVVTPWGTLFTDQVEPVFNTVEGVNRTALVGVTRGSVTYPVVCVEPDPDQLGRHYPVTKKGLAGGRAVWAAVRSRLLDIGARSDHTRMIETFLAHPGTFPVDVRHNSKIFREKLAVWADKTLGKRWNPGDNTRVRPTGSGAPA